MATKVLSEKEKAAQFDKMKAAHKKASLRRQARIAVILRKAAAMNPPIIATEAEIDAELKK